MAIDSTLPVRQAILTLLKADSAITALVPAERIYPQVAQPTPAWPFILYGAPSGIPIRASCLDGNEITVAVHAFAKPREEDGQVVETAEDHAARIGAFIGRALDGQRPPIPGGYAAIRWRGSQLLIDGGEADAFHAVVNFRVRAITN